MEENYSSRNRYSSNSPSDYDRYIILENELKKDNAFSGAWLLTSK